MSSYPNKVSQNNADSSSQSGSGDGNKSWSETQQQVKSNEISFNVQNEQEQSATDITQSKLLFVQVSLLLQIFLNVNFKICFLGGMYSSCFKRCFSSAYQTYMN